MRQEMLGLDVWSLQLSLISQTVHVQATVLAGPGINSSIHLHTSLTLGKSQPGCIFRTINLYITIDADTARNTDFLSQGRIKHRRHHTEVIGTGLQIDIRLQMVPIHQIGNRTISTQLETRRQTQPDSREGSTLHISLKWAFYLHRIVRPSVLHLLRQGITYKEEKIRTSQGSVYTSHDLARIFLGKSIHIEIYRSLQIRNWGTKIEIRQLHLHRIHYESAIELVDLQSAFLLQLRFLNLHINPGIAEIERICLQFHIREGKMIEIHTRNWALEILVVVHPSVLPIQMLYLIQTFIQVEIE